MSGTTPAPFDVAAARGAARDAASAAISLGIFPSTFEGVTGLVDVGQRRRRRRVGAPDPVSTVSLLLNDEGVLLWHDAAPARATGRRRARRGVPLAPDGETVELYQFEPLAPNEVGQFLSDLDAQLNGAPGLTRLTRQSGPTALLRTALPAPPTGRKRRLLFVHGTFSSTDAFQDGIAAAPGGDAFLQRLFAQYDEVLAFDHETLSVSPMLNAFDLARLLQRIDGPLDVIAHSRGGLVTRWTLEGFGVGGRGPFRGVLVGSPLGGTSLASPPRLRSSLSLVSNLGTALKIAGSAASIYLPLLAAPVALLRVATSVVSVASRTPLIDAAVQMIPGLAGQSRVGNNPELARIRAVRLASPPAYFVVQSDFETEAAGWRFWRWFSRKKAADVGADTIFRDRNDLVVDTASMTEFSPQAFPAARVKDFGTNDQVHHCNYFARDETLDFILDRLGIP